MSDVVLRYRDKVLFGIGASGESATNWIFNTLAFFFYNQVIGLPGTLSAIAVGLGIVADALTDPIVGVISDRFRSRLGRRHPFMLLAPVPLILTMFALFSPPGEGSDFQTFLWLVSVMMVMRLFSTLYAVPHLAFGAELTSGYYERTRIMAYNNIFYFVGTIFMHLATWFFIFPAHDNGRFSQDAYWAVVAVYALFTLAALYGSAVGTLPFAKRSQLERQSKSTFSDGMRDIWRVVGNRNYRVLLIGLFFLAMTIGTHETLGIYLASFYWRLSDEQIGWLILYSVVGYIAGFVLVVPIQQWLDKRLAIVASATGLSVFWSAAIILSLFGLAPEPGSWTLVSFIMVWGAFASTCASILNISVMSALADVAEEHSARTGFRQEATFYSARTFFAKVSNAIGHVVAGVALDLIDFPENAVVGEVAESQLFALALIDGPFAMVWGLGAALIYAQYRLSREEIGALRESGSKQISTGTNSRALDREAALGNRDA